MLLLNLALLMNQAYVPHTCMYFFAKVESLTKSELASLFEQVLFESWKNFLLKTFTVAKECQDRPFLSICHQISPSPSSFWNEIDILEMERGRLSGWVGHFPHRGYDIEKDTTVEMHILSEMRKVDESSTFFNSGTESITVVWHTRKIEPWVEKKMDPCFHIL